MTSLLSVLALMLLAAWLSNLDRIPWPIQRTEPMYSVAYWQTVRNDSISYLNTHHQLSVEVRTEIMRTIKKADKRLGN